MDRGNPRQRRPPKLPGMGKVKVRQIPRPPTKSTKVRTVNVKAIKKKMNEDNSKKFEEVEIQEEEEEILSDHEEVTKVEETNNKQNISIVQIDEVRDSLIDDYDVDEGTEDANDVNTNEIEEVKVPLTSLSPHKTGSQYIAPRFDVRKYNPRTKNKLMMKDRIWEVNFSERIFANIVRKNFKRKRVIPFQKLERVRIDRIDNEELLILNFKGIHPFRLKLESKKKIQQFYEVCKCAMPGAIVYSPHLLGDKKNIVKVNLTGKFHYEHSQGGKFIVEQKELINTHIYVSTPFENSLIWITTWNLEYYSLPKKSKVLDAFIPKGKDIYAICLQEAKKNADSYINYFKKFLKKRKVQLIQSGNIAGVILMVFAKQENISNSKLTKLYELDKKGFSKSEGAVIIKFDYNESPLCFIGCNILGGEEAIAQKLKTLTAIQEEIVTPFSFADFHHTFLIGSLNFRVSLPPTLSEKYIKQKKKEILQFDQLKALQEKKRFFVGWKEGQIEFDPTHNIPSEKGFPSFTDRIIVKSYPHLSCKIEEYSSYPSVRVSTHAPVFGTFRIDTMRPHVSVYSTPSKPKKLLIANMYVSGNYTTQPIKDPQLILNAMFLEEQFRTKKLKEYSPIMNPSFPKEAFPKEGFFFRKTCLRFLENAFIKVQLLDGDVTIGFAVLPLKKAINNFSKDAKFDIPLFNGFKQIGSLLGTFKCVEK